MGWLSSTASCESHGNYRTATGNGYYGGLQFSLSTWRSVGGRGYPHQNPALEQKYRAVLLVRTGGTGHWAELRLKAGSGLSARSSRMTCK